MTLLERYNFLLTRSDKEEGLETKYPIVDTRDHLPFLRSVAKGFVLEIGTDVGNSTTALLLGVEENDGYVYSCDIRNCCNVMPECKRWTFIWTDSKELVRFLRLDELRNNWIDMLYIDGDHRYEGISHDLSLGKYVKNGGLILVHDVNHVDYPGVRRAFDEYTPFKSKRINMGSNGLGVIYV